MTLYENCHDKAEDTCRDHGTMKGELPVNNSAVRKYQLLMQAPVGRKDRQSPERTMSTAPDSSEPDVSNLSDGNMLFVPCEIFVFHMDR